MGILNRIARCGPSGVKVIDASAQAPNTGALAKDDKVGVIEFNFSTPVPIAWSEKDAKHLNARIVAESSGDAIQLTSDQPAKKKGILGWTPFNMRGAKKTKEAMKSDLEEVTTVADDTTCAETQVDMPLPWQMKPSVGTWMIMLPRPHGEGSIAGSVEENAVLAKSGSAETTPLDTTYAEVSGNDAVVEDSGANGPESPKKKGMFSMSFNMRGTKTTNKDTKVILVKEAKTAQITGDANLDETAPACPEGAVIATAGKVEEAQDSNACVDGSTVIASTEVTESKAEKKGMLNWTSFNVPGMTKKKADSNTILVSEAKAEQASGDTNCPGTQDETAPQSTPVNAIALKEANAENGRMQYIDTLEEGQMDTTAAPSDTAGVHAEELHCATVCAEGATSDDNLPFFGPEEAKKKPTRGWAPRSPFHLRRAKDAQTATTRDPVEDFKPIPDDANDDKAVTNEQKDAIEAMSETYVEMRGYVDSFVCVEEPAAIDDAKAGALDGTCAESTKKKKGIRGWAPRSPFHKRGPKDADAAITCDHVEDVKTEPMADNANDDTAFIDEPNTERQCLEAMSETYVEMRGYVEALPVSAMKCREQIPPAPKKKGILGWTPRAPFRMRGAKQSAAVEECATEPMPDTANEAETQPLQMASADLVLVAQAEAADVAKEAQEATHEVPSVALVDTKSQPQSSESAKKTGIRAWTFPKRPATKREIEAATTVGVAENSKAEPMPEDVKNEESQQMQAATPALGAASTQAEANSGVSEPAKTKGIRGWTPFRTRTTKKLVATAEQTIVDEATTAPPPDDTNDFEEPTSPVYVRS